MSNLLKFSAALVISVASISQSHAGILRIIGKEMVAAAKEGVRDAVEAKRKPTVHVENSLNNNKIRFGGGNGGNGGQDDDRPRDQASPVGR